MISATQTPDVDSNFPTVREKGRALLRITKECALVFNYMPGLRVSYAETMTMQIRTMLISVLALKGRIFSLTINATVDHAELWDWSVLGLVCANQVEILSNARAISDMLESYVHSVMSTTSVTRKLVRA